jgi:hypothetical protein
MFLVLLEQVLVILTQQKNNNISSFVTASVATSSKIYIICNTSFGTTANDQAEVLCITNLGHQALVLEHQVL